MTRRLVNFLIGFCFFLFPLQIFAQNFPILHYTIDDGLPSNTVYSVYRDSKGFIWIATLNGISRFNGIRFETFTTADGMPDNEIFFFQEDHYGRLWLASYNGELSFYKDGRFFNAHKAPFLTLPVKSSQINHIILEKDSSVTFLFANPDKFININKEKVAVVDLPRPRDKAGYFYQSKLSGSTYSFIHLDSIVVVDTNHRILSSKLISNIGGAARNGEWRIVNAQDQKYILNGSSIFTRDMKPVYNCVHKNDNIKTHSVYFDHDNKMFMNTDSGVYIGENTHILNSVRASSITQDIMKNYWIGSLVDGVYLLDSRYIHTSIYQNVYKGEAWYTYADDHNLFFTNSENCLFQMKKDGTNCLFNCNRYKSDKLESGSSHGFLVLRDPSNVKYKYLNYFLNGIYTVDDLTNSPKVSVGPKPLVGGEIVKSIVDVGDKLYIRTIKKVFSIKIADFLNSSKFDTTGKLEIDDGERIFAFAKSNENEVWLSTRKGVYKLTDNKAAIQKQFKDITFKKFEFFDKYLIGHTDVDNRLLVCSEISGKIVFDTIKKHSCIWDRFYKLDSIHMLITTNNLYRLFTINPPGSKTKYSITVIESPFIPLRAESVSSDNKNCYFFLNGAITKIDIENLLQKPRAPELFYTFLKYGNRRFWMKDRLQVAYQGSKNISISFLTLSFAGKSLTYEYSSSNTETDNWQSINGEEINLATPHYGTYTIKVKAKSISSEFCPPIEFVLEILPPFWATWWFISICVCVGAGLVILAVRYRILWVIKKAEKENEIKIRFMKSEYKALNALMNPHFIFNTLNNVQGLVNRNDKLAANEYLRIFADLVRQNMHNVSKEMIPLQKEIDLVANYMALEKLRFKELMNYSVNVDDDVDTAIIMVPPLFIQPLVENSIKHGIFPRQSPDSWIKLNVYEVGDVLHIEVKDNGVGLSASAKKANTLHESFGLKNIQDRIQQMSIMLGKKIEFKMEEVQEEDGQWTVVSIKMSF